MQEKKILRIWQWSVILLVLCNIGLILTIWLKPQKAVRPGQAPREYVIASLKFTDEQVKQYDLLIKDHRHAMNQLQKESMDLHQQFFAGLKSNIPSASTADSLSSLIANNQKQIELVTFQHFEQVRKICTDAQKAVFDNIIGDVMKRMNNLVHGGPPPRGAVKDGNPGQGQQEDDRRPPPQDGNGPPPDGQDLPPDGQGPPPDGR